MKDEENLESLTLNKGLDMVNKKNPTAMKAAELRQNYESKVREAADKRNSRISQAKSDFEAEVKAIRREIYG